MTITNERCVCVGWVRGERAGPRSGRAAGGAGAGEASLHGQAGYTVLLRQAAQLNQLSRPG